MKVSFHNAVHDAPLLRAHQVSRDYDLAGSAVHAVRDVSLDVRAGDYVAIVGPSGCGKSSLLNLVGAIDRPSAGRVEIAGRDVSRLSDGEATEFRLRNIGFVFQRFYLLPMLSARENVELPMAEAGVAKGERRSRAVELLRYVGLDRREAHRPAQLSGGEQQRVAIARALANSPSLILADEPTGELDASTGREMIALFGRLNVDGTTIVVVTHDEALARSARRVVHMVDGRIVSDEPNDRGAPTEAGEPNDTRELDDHVAQVPRGDQAATGGPPRTTSSQHDRDEPSPIRRTPQ